MQTHVTWFKFSSVKHSKKKGFVLLFSNLCYFVLVNFLKSQFAHRASLKTQTGLMENPLCPAL